MPSHRSLVPRALRFALLAALVAAAGTAVARAGSDLHRELLPHPDDPERQVELYWSAPDSDGPRPALLFVHGHQFPTRPGAWRYVERDLLAAVAADGLVAAAVSQPGYGASDGPPDFCGPFSQAAVHAAIARLRELEQVQADRIVVFGYSRGAAVASMVAAQDDRLAGVILGGGNYDLVTRYAEMDTAIELQARIRHNIDLETGGTHEAFVARSALLADPPIRVPTLILHGEDDPNIPVRQARVLESHLRSLGTPVELVVFPGVGHGIPAAQRRPYVESFLTRYAWALELPQWRLEPAPESPAAGP